MKVKDVSIQITCLEEDVEEVRESMNRWFCNNDVSMVQRSTGGIRMSEPKPIQKWMREVLCPEENE